MHIIPLILAALLICWAFAPLFVGFAKAFPTVAVLRPIQTTPRSIFESRRAGLA